MNMASVANEQGRGQEMNPGSYDASIEKLFSSAFNWHIRRWETGDETPLVLLLSKVIDEQNLSRSTAERRMDGTRMTSA